MKQILCALLFVISLAGQVPYERILQADREPESWLTYSGTYRSHRYSTLDQITRENVSRLQPAWMYQIRARHKFETSPLVVDGIMYITEPPSDVTALDLRTGRPVWSYRRSLPEGVIACCGQVNRGVAFLDDQIFVGTVDAYLVALDAKTGKLAWRFWTVPGPGEPGNETWSGDSWKRGGAPTWTTGSYDPELNLIYWGTGNPGPDFIGEVRLGDNLYSECLIALDADTGELKWYFQFLPHDIHDYDATQVPVLLNADFEGKPRKLVLFANRNAFYYILDRVTGEYLLGKEFAHQTWAKGLDENGRPIENLETTPSVEGALVYPDDDGAANWYSPSYSPQTNLFYQNVRDKGAIYYRGEAIYEPGKLYFGASRRRVPGEDPKGFLRALHPLTGELAWEFPLHSPPWAGLLSTAGGLVFSGTMEGDFFAADAKTGKLLWRFQTGGACYANPISYVSEGKQYIAIASGSALITFALDPKTK